MISGNFNTASLRRKAAFAVIVAILAGAAGAGAADRRESPLVADLRRVNVEIADIAFVEEVAGIDGNNMRISPANKDKFRLALVTLRITKPPGEKLTLAAADLTLHYFHGEATEAAPCEGLSVFSTSREVDRPVKMPQHPGPGFVKQTTGTVSTQASTVYVDALFGYIEPTINDVWIAVAQPSTVAPFRSTGWTNGRR